MSRRQQQHMGRSEGDDREIEGRDRAGDDLQEREAAALGEERAREARTHDVVTDHEVHPDEASSDKSATDPGSESGR